MINFQVYQLLHITSIILIFTALGARIAEALLTKNPKKSPLKRWIALAHGVGMLMSLVGGFGMLARLGVAFPFPLWIWVKLIVWLALGGLLAVIPRNPKHAKKFLYVLIFCAALAAYMAIFKLGQPRVM